VKNAPSEYSDAVVRQLVCRRHRSIWYGSINSARVQIKSEYKLAIRTAAMDFEKSHIDEVTEYFAHKDMNNFWKSWNAKYCKHINASNITNGYQKAPDIANAFRGERL